MSIKVLNRKLLWGRAGNRCAFPGCFQSLTENLNTEESDLLAQVGVVMGEEAHIKSGQVSGPRYDPTYTKVDDYENLILLCPTHHTLIDKNSGVGFSVDDILAMKGDHERGVEEKLGPDEVSRRKLSERMAALLSIWEDKFAVDHWKDWTAELNQPIPRLADSRYVRWIEAGHWMLGMRWPRQFPRTLAAMDGFDRVMSDLMFHLDACMHYEGGFFRELNREYKQLRRWDPEAYKRLFAEFQVERNLIWALVIEATRSVNWVISEASLEVDEFFRFDKGVALMGDGDGLIRSYVARLEYTSDQTALPDGPYPGIDPIRSYMEEKVRESAHYFDSKPVSEAIEHARQIKESAAAPVATSED